MQSYIPRSIEKNLLKSAKQFPVVMLTGPRQTGKSTTLKKIFKKYKYISLDDPFNRKQALEDPCLFLEQISSNAIIDEIQYAPELLSYIKIEVDKNRSNNGQYILTGSQIFNLMKGVSESLAGRIALHELLGFSIHELYSNKNIKTSASKYFDTIFRGTFPEPCVNKIDTNTFYSSYIQTYLERDIRQIRSVHDLRLFQNFLELLAARAGSLLNLNEIAKECGISQTTAKNWTSLLESTRIIYLLRPYYKNITKRVIKSHKLYFTDTGLLTYLLRYPNTETLMSGPMAGNISENILIMEILKNKFNSSARFELYFYRDSSGNEIDLVLDFGIKTKLIEFKTSKTLQTNHYKPIKKLLPLFNTPSAFLISLHPKKVILDDNITALPWWDVNKVAAD